MLSSVADLVHEDKCSFKGIVDFLIDLICHTLLSNLFPPKLEVIIPQLVAINITQISTV